MDVGNDTAPPELHVDVFVDISPHLDRNNSVLSIESQDNNTAATVTYFKVPTETACHVTITSVSGEAIIRFEDGHIDDWIGYSIRNVSTHMGDVFVTYISPLDKLSFQCECLNQTYNCSGVFENYFNKTNLYNNMGF